MTIPGDGEPVADVKAKPAWARRVTGMQAEDEGEDSSTGAQPETESVWSTPTFPVVQRTPMKMTRRSRVVACRIGQQFQICHLLGVPGGLAGRSRDKRGAREPKPGLAGMTRASARGWQMV